MGYNPKDANVQLLKQMKDNIIWSVYSHSASRYNTQLRKILGKCFVPHISCWQTLEVILFCSANYNYCTGQGNASFGLSLYFVESLWEWESPSLCCIRKIGTCTKYVIHILNKSVSIIFYKYLNILKYMEHFIVRGRYQCGAQKF